MLTRLRSRKGALFAPSSRERRAIESNDICRLATISEDGWPHVVPVGYIYSGGRFYIPSSPRTAKVANLRRRPRAAIVIDETSGSGVMLTCRGEVLAERRAMHWSRVLHDQKGWDTGENVAVICLTPIRSASWFPKSP